MNRSFLRFRFWTLEVIAVALLPLAGACTPDNQQPEAKVQPAGEIAQQAATDEPVAQPVKPEVAPTNPLEGKPRPEAASPPVKTPAAAAKESTTQPAKTNPATPLDTRSAEDRPLSPEERKAEEARAELEKKLEMNLAPLRLTKPDGAAADPDDPYITPKELERRLGPPLVNEADKLIRLDPMSQLWVDRPPRNVILVGAVCQRRVPLEMFACLKGSKEHESVVVVYTNAQKVHAALVAAKADPGRPVQFQPKYIPAEGPEIEITMIWKDEKGQRHRARAQDWVRQSDTKKALEYPWVFTGSQIRFNEVTRQHEYWADADGCLICVSNFSSAMLDLPVRSSDANAELSFEAFTEHIPARGTPVTLVLTPQPRPQPTEKQPAAPKPPA